MNHEYIVEVLKEIGFAVRRQVNNSLKTQSSEYRSSVYRNEATDLIYQIDKDVEDVIVNILEKHASEIGGLILLAEGIGDEINGLLLPRDIKEEEEAKIRIIIDPIDGTRGIMYDKRSAFFLAGVAPNKGKNTRLSDIEVALMTELPTSRAYLSDTIYSIKGRGIFASTYNFFTNRSEPKQLQISKAKTILGGFAQLVRFFPPGRDILSAIEDELIEQIAPELGNERAIVFEDQYISTGGQIYELLVGHDRFIGDIRNTLYQELSKQGKSIGHVCHPYDICILLIAQEAGIIISDPKGEILDAPMDLLSAVDWLGFANEAIYNQIFPPLSKLIEKHIYRLENF